MGYEGRRERGVFSFLEKEMDTNISTKDNNKKFKKAKKVKEKGNRGR